jgi:hypothetical protein
MPDIEANAMKLAIDGSAAASFFNLQSPLGADALKVPTLVSTRVQHLYVIPCVVWRPVEM